eukprot:4763494-Pyramimonas_sp.AAC.1
MELTSSGSRILEDYLWMLMRGERVPLSSLTMRSATICASWRHAVRDKVIEENSPAQKRNRLRSSRVCANVSD